MLSYIFLALFCYIFFLYQCHCRVSSREELETVRVKAVTLHCLIRHNQFVLLWKTLTKDLHICICRILGVYIYTLIVNKVYINWNYRSTTINLLSGSFNKNIIFGFILIDATISQRWWSFKLVPLLRSKFDTHDFLFYSLTLRAWLIYQQIEVIGYYWLFIIFWHWRV